MMMGGEGCCTGTGWPLKPLAVTWGPATSSASPVKNALRKATVSARRAMRVGASDMVRPMASYSLATQPAPMPSSSRPSDSRSSVAIDFASTTGWW